MNTETANRISTEILEACSLVDGKLTLSDASFLEFSNQIKAAKGPSSWGPMLIALVNRLRGVPGAGPAAERVLALAAVALGDKELNRLVNEENRR